MAVKFKSKYTAQQIEDILDSVGATELGSLVRVEELPNPKDANTAQFYIYDDQVWYVNVNTDPRTWAVVSTNDSDQVVDKNEGLIDADVALTVNEIDFSDFTDNEDGTFTIIDGTPTQRTITELKILMINGGRNYYTLSGVIGYGWIEGVDGNNVLTAKGAYNTSGIFYIQLDLIDGIEVKLVESNNVYTINYVGYAL